MLFKPRGVTSNDPKYAGNSSIMTLQELLAYRDTWTERLSDDFSLGSILQKARSEKNKPVVPEKLTMSENGFKVKGREEIDESERAVRMVQSSLNKLTKSNFDVLLKPILTPEIVLNDYVIKKVVELIYEKALGEPFFVGLYASMCEEISKCEHHHRVLRGEKDLSTRRVHMALVEKCQEMFDTVQDAVSLTKEEGEKLHKRKLTNIKFTGELFLKSLISSNIIGKILHKSLPSGNPTEAGLEVIINLLEVIGKRYEESRPSLQDLLWTKLEKLQRDKNFSNRLRFLLQNLIDRRNGKWKPRPSEIVDTPDSAENQAQEQPQLQSQQVVFPTGDSVNKRATPQYNPHPRDLNNRRSSPSMGKRDQSFQDLPTSYNAGQQRVTSCNELSSLMSSPPPLHDGGQTTTKEHYVENDSKALSRTRPPDALNLNVQKKIISIVTGALRKGTQPEQLLSQLGESVPGENYSSSLTSSVYAMLYQYIRSSDESEQKVLREAFLKGIFSYSIVCRGFAWCLTKIISDRWVKDYLDVYSRFVSATMFVPGLDFVFFIKEVMSRTTNYLDSLYAQYSSGEWEEDFIKVWEMVLCSWKKNQRLQEVKSTTILDCVASLPQKTFMRSIMPDFIAELTRFGLSTEDLIKKWISENESNVRYANFIEEINQLYA